MILTSDAYAAELSTLSDGELITDDMARTVASWWQSPGPIGRHLAAFASGAEVTHDAVMADVQDAMDERPSVGTDDLSRLLAWLREDQQRSLATVWSSCGHRFIGSDEYDECLTCGAVARQVTYLNARVSSFYENNAGEGIAECTGDTAMVHGFPGEREAVCEYLNGDHVDGADTCAHCGHDCNCCACE